MCQEIYIKEKVYSGVLGKGTEVIMKGLEREREECIEMKKQSTRQNIPKAQIYRDIMMLKLRK